MLHLPLELQHQCLHYFDVNTLKALRLVNKSLLDLVTEPLFITVNLLPTEESVEKYNAIIKNDRLNSLVRTVVFNTSLNPNIQYDDPEWDVETSEDPEEFFLKAISELKEFANVSAVSLNFSQACAAPHDVNEGVEKEVPENGAFRSNVLSRFFRSVIEANGIETMSIKNLQDCTSVFVRSKSGALRPKVKKLALCIATEYDDAAPEHNISLPACRTFFTFDLPSYWLKPTQDQLTHLTLYTGSEYSMWGIYPFCDFRPFHFSKLKSLCLGNWTIGHEWQVDWIVRHGETLQELVLDNCPIAVALSMSEEQADVNSWTVENSEVEKKGTEPNAMYIKHISLRWHDVFSRLQTTIPHLKKFVIGRGDWEAYRAFEERHELLPRLLKSRYYIFDWGSATQWRPAEDNCGEPFRDLNEGWEVEIDYPDEEVHKKDWEALVRLLEVVGKRVGV